jgi:hypothetical protein
VRRPPFFFSPSAVVFDFPPVFLAALVGAARASQTKAGEDGGKADVPLPAVDAGFFSAAADLGGMIECVGVSGVSERGGEREQERDGIRRRSAAF